MTLASLAALIESAYQNCPTNTPLKDVWPVAAKAVVLAVADEIERMHFEESPEVAIRGFIEPETKIQTRDGDAVMF